MEPPPPPPPPHGSNPQSGPKSGGLPDGKYDIFVIPPSSAGSGFIYLPSLNTQRNSFLAGVICTATSFLVYQTAVPVIKEWFFTTINGGGQGVFMLMVGVAVLSWAFGKTQGEGTQPANAGARSGPGSNASDSHSAGAGFGGPRPQTTPPPPPPPPPPPRPSTPPESEPESKQAPPHPPPPTPPKPEPPPQTSPPPPKSSWQRPPPAKTAADAKSSWEKAREETRKREEEKRRAEEIKRRREELEKDKLRQREKEARERLERELREKREREIQELNARKEQLEKACKEREDREKREKEQREVIDKLEREKRERDERDERERRASREKEAMEAKERETKEREAREREAREKAAKELAERLKREAEEAARTAKKPPIPTAATERDDDAYSFRPYDRRKRSAKTNSAESVYSEDSYAPSATTAKTTPPPSVRGPYTTKDPDKIIIKAVYSFNNAFQRTPIAQLVSGSGNVTDGLILRITTEGLFIDDDVRSVPQREWDVKAWTMKLAEVWCPKIPFDKHVKDIPSTAASRRPTPFPNQDQSCAFHMRFIETCARDCRAAALEQAGRRTSGHLQSSTAPITSTSADNIVIQNCEVKDMHVLRASIRDQEGKRYVFIIPQSEGWKVAVGLQRLRRGTQVRALGVAGLPQNEAKALIETLGWG